MKIRNLEEANAALLPYVPLVAQLTGKDTTLDRIWPLMAALGNPQQKVPIVHIAGTSGKTSTAYFMAALLGATGKRVGLTVSPHVDSVTERVQIGGTPISDEQFCDYLGKYLELVEATNIRPSYFELLYAFSFWVFEREGVEYAVVETGMGGLHDATNVADAPNKLCIITDIGYDHMHLLGSTLPEIAAQKAGIIHPGNTAFKYRQTPEIDDVFQRWAKEQEAEMRWVDEAAERQKTSRLADDMALFQQRNWLLAHTAFDWLRQRDGLPSLDEAQLAQTQQVQVPGRMDIRHDSGKTIVMDGAHNGQKMQTFLASFRQRFPGERPAVLLALKEGKESAEVSRLLATITDDAIVTTFETSQDLPARAIDPQLLTAELQKAGVGHVEVIPDLSAAYAALLGRPNPVCIVTGSFYLLSQLREKAGLR